MKVIISLVAVAIVGALLYFGLNNLESQEKDSELATTTPTTSVDLVDGEYEVDKNRSNISWVGTKELIANYEDLGTLSVQAGNFVITAGQITAGEVVFDMNSLMGTKTSNTQIGLDKLATHLKSKDFFDVETYPTSTMNISNVVDNGDSTYSVNGNLTVKDVTESITFPATISVSEIGEVTINGDFIMDRTKWGLQYGSGSFFDNLGDNVISDTVSISVNIVANLKN